MRAYVLEILWNRLLSIAEEQAQVLMRTAFSTIVREAGDLSAAVFDRRGRMVAQARTGTPGHINTMARGMRFFLEEFPLETIEPGDVLISNELLQARGPAQRYVRGHAGISPQPGRGFIRQLLPHGGYRRGRPDR